jgi:glycosyltransferase involved in cell wall biosynthesis
MSEKPEAEIARLTAELKKTQAKFRHEQAARHLLEALALRKVDTLLGLLKERVPVRFRPLVRKLGEGVLWLITPLPWKQRLEWLRTGVRIPGSRKANKLHLPTAGLDPAKDTVFLISHAADQTGAPILAWNVLRELRRQYNVVALLVRGGALEWAFEQNANIVLKSLIRFDGRRYSEALAVRLAEAYKPLYAVANTTETRRLAVSLAKADVPVVALVHEFSGMIRPPMVLEELFRWTSHVVFPSRIVEQSFVQDYPTLRAAWTHVIAQGHPTVPARTGQIADSDTPRVAGDALRRLLRPAGYEDALLVVGMGFVEMRKGIEFFISTAIACQRLLGPRQVRFVWIGGGYKPGFIFDYSTVIAEQIARSDLGDGFAMLAPVDDVASVYDEADLLYISSRLDPMPNVAIEMSLAGKPVLCFQNSTGMVEVLEKSDITKPLIVPYADTGAAAELVARLANDKPFYDRVSVEIKTLAEASFDMPRYIREIDALGRQASLDIAAQQGDPAVLAIEGNFDTPLYAGYGNSRISQQHAINLYLHYSRSIDWRKPTNQFHLRRGLAGFHPPLYAQTAPGFPAQGKADPLVHYARAGKPAGPWQHEIIRLADKMPAVASSLKTALHGHFHYTDHIADFLAALAPNQSRCDLYLTATSEEKASVLRQATAQYGQGSVDISVVPNKGRDIGSFLAFMQGDAAAQYEIIGHVHGKRSLYAVKDPGLGDRWRNFLWQQLLGPRSPVMDVILARFAAEPRLGLVFPEDPVPIGWDGNYEIAQDLMRRMDLSDQLPVHIDFPVGTMFWARREALAPLRKLSIAWEDYPAEPVPVDGTMLHALERLLPQIAVQSGYSYGATYFAGVNR